ncbi:hypothetical protein FHW83_003334 [Duganella sp. SG902]|uniref:hypothetical protein n=1 Tax=Duganella sp. SG902 TaxID=2587016 RepID=UPI00159D4B2D|nr:hypothetical protein [Duganella sp. SG902]NVM77516.1 hypothetical protein [Duganella sp. SG902]
MPLAQRLPVLIASAVLGLVSMVACAILLLDHVYTKAHQSYAHTVPGVLKSDNAFRQAVLLPAFLWEYLAVSDPVEKSKLASRIAVAHAQVIAALDQYENEDVAGAQDQASLQTVRSAYARYDVVRKKVLVLADAGRPDAARDFLVAKRLVFVELVNAFDKQRWYRVDTARRNADKEAAAIRRGKRQSALMCLAIIVAIMASGLMLARKIGHALDETALIEPTATSPAALEQSNQASEYAAGAPGRSS